MTHSIHLKSEFELPAKAWSFSKNTGNMTIVAEAECMGRARKICADLELALEYGAVPAAHALMIEKINEANRQGLPLACSMEFKP